jgi:MFS family permease
LQQRQLTSARQSMVIAALFAAEVAGAFETAMILAATKSLLDAFKDPVLIGWLMTGYLLVGAAAAAVIGRLGDLYGRRRVLLVTLGLGAAGSLLSALSPDYATLLVGRVIQGLTGAVLPLCVGLVRENLPAHRMSMGIGLMVSGASGGYALGLVFGGWLVDGFGWRAIFFASAVFCLTSALAVLLILPKSARSPSRAVDWVSGIMFAPGILALLYFLSEGAKRGWSDPVSLATLLLAVLLLGWWLRQSLTSSAPLLDVRQFRNRNVFIANAVTALLAVSALQAPLLFSIMLQAPKWTLVGLGLSATTAGLIKLPSTLISLGAGPFSGWLVGRGGGRLAMTLGASILTLGWVVVWFFHATPTQVLISLCIMSFGTAMTFAVGPTILAIVSAEDRTSEISGMLTVVRQSFLGIGAQIVTTILAADVLMDRSGASHPSPHAFSLTIGYIIVVCCAATLVGLALRVPRPDK